MSQLTYIYGRAGARRKGRKGVISERAGAPREGGSEGNRLGDIWDTGGYGDEWRA